jgi:hypothetical protein
MIKRLVYILLGIPLAWASAQRLPVTDTAGARLLRYQQSHLMEKVFVHTDKSFYLPGQIIWYKVYAVDAATNRPVDLSKVAYVEVVGTGGRALLQGKIALAGGSGDGSFQVPPSLTTGNYVLRAYTAWMKNGSPDFYYEQALSIVNPLKDPPASPGGADAYDIQFFPEGGNLVSGLASKVGFRIVDRFGKGMPAKGAVLDAAGDTVTTFSPLVFGLGHFMFRPRDGQHYSAVVRVGDTVLVRSLPRVYDRGVVMGVADAPGGQLRVTVNARGVTAPFVYLLVHHQGQVLQTAALELKDGEASTLVNRGEGLLHLTLFDGNGHPLTERLAFVYPSRGLDIRAAPDTLVYKPRQKVTIDLSADGSADLSMAVGLEDTLQGPVAGDIVSYFWLRSDLKGTIESPGYYFDSTKTDRAAALDNLLLTQGWSRWRWEDILSPRPETPRFLPEYEGHLITGRVVDKRTEQPAPGVSVYLSLPGKYFRVAEATSDSAGQIRFNMDEFFGGNVIVVQVENGADSVDRVEINTPFSDAYTTNPVPAFRFPPTWKNDLLLRSVNTQVMNAFPTSGSQRFLFPTDTLPFALKADASYKLDDYTRFTTMEEIFREYVPEVNVSRRKTGFELQVFKANARIFFEEKPLILLDGVPYFNEDTVVAFDPLKIRQMDVLTQRYYAGSHYFSGVISLSTYHNDLADFRLDPAALVLEYEGLQPERESFTPVYDGAQSTRIPDFRDMLDWSPRLKTGPSLRTRVSFYTSDIPGTFRGVVQGISGDGLPGIRTFTFLVKP